MGNGYIDDAIKKKRSDDMYRILTIKSENSIDNSPSVLPETSNSIYCRQDLLAVSIDLCMVKRDLFDKFGSVNEGTFKSLSLI